jgi:GTPase
VQEAALIVHVSDVSSAHHQELDEAVKKILDELGVAVRPTLHVWNKSDLLSPEEKAEWQKSVAHPPEGTAPPVLVSALTGEGLDELLKRIDETLPADPVVKVTLRVPLTEGRALALVHALGHVYHSELEDSHMLLDAEVPLSMARKLKLQNFSVNGTF